MTSQDHHKLLEEYNDAMRNEQLVTDDMMLAAMPVLTPHMNGTTLEEKRKLIRVAIANVLFVIAERDRERVARWMIAHSYATGHGDTIEDLLGELALQASPRLIAALRRIADLCPATCDMTLAHEMAEIAENALAMTLVQIVITKTAGGYKIALMSPSETTEVIEVVDWASLTRRLQYERFKLVKVEPINSRPPCSCGVCQECNWARNNV